MIGKRKRDTAVVSRSTKATKADAQENKAPTTTDTDNSQDLFRKFFEAQFQPLEVPGGRADKEAVSEKEEESEEEESEAGSDWEGLSGEEDEGNEVEVVEHQSSSTKKDDLWDKRARKAFMRAKLPSFDLETTNAKATPAKNGKEDKDDGTDAENLKKDLALQRLLKESHLLESAEELDPTGKNRHKALDLRMQSLGANASLYKQKMPSLHRRGIKAKAEKKEDRRRQDAKENGIILEKPTNKSKPSAGRRERSVGGPSIGKFSGGTLNLSKRDLSAMTTPRRSTKGKGKGKSRR